ncbi:TetR/AcrR family transcriptional regulator [Novosphingobium colocasiae]|uniref:TetR/AcrR family transcriptional regulator n=1 Tax=Novosphingobium colocasiae TaxID=1256513 RepID=UPI00167B8009|nr:TetR/AcrR family transcriptional regulator [Novosphingobium colocasiae]
MANRITPSYREAALSSSAKPQRRTQAERSEAMRARLAAAAFETISQGGFNALRMRNVANAAGVSQGALMHHFPDKNMLVLAAVEQALELARHDSDASALAPDASPETVLRALIDDLHGFFFSDRFWVAIGITLEASRDQEFYPDVRRRVSGLRTPFYEGWQQRLVVAGWTEEQSRIMVRSAAAMVSGSAIRRFWAPSDELEAAVTDQWVNDWLARR